MVRTEVETEFTQLFDFQISSLQYSIFLSMFISNLFHIVYEKKKTRTSELLLRQTLNVEWKKKS